MSIALGRRVLYWLLVLVIAAASGLAVTRVELALLLGGLIGALLVFVVARRPYVGLLAYVVVFGLRLAELYPALAPLRPEFLLGAMTFSLLILSQVRRHGGIALDSSRQSKHFYFVILAAFLSVPMAVWRGGAWEGVIDFVKLLIFYLLIVHLVDTRAKLRGLVAVHCVLVLVLAVGSTSSYLKGALLQAQGIDRAVGMSSIASGPNELGATMATTIPLFLFFALNRGAGRLRNTLFIGMGIMIFTMVITGSRSAFIGFLASLAFFAWQSRHRVALLIAGALFVVGMFAVMPEQYKGRYSSITQAELDESSEGRIQLWKKGLRMIADRPITGVGLKGFPTANAHFYSTGRPSWLESHSLYIQVPAEMGLVGAFAFFSFILVFIGLNRRLAQQLEDEDGWEYEHALLRGMFVGLLVLLVTSVFGHSMMRPTWYIYAGIGLATLRIYDAHRPDLDPKERKRLFG